tara:strand:+ start:9146 stop:10399 length:1254 start_codon:yes stop_codon:yes gene_type:complete
MKWLIAIILIPNFVFSQKDTTILLENVNKNLVKWNTEFNFTTNGLNQSFLNSFTDGGDISVDIKNQWLDLSKESNTIYFELNNSISYQNNIKKFGLEIADRNIINVSVSKDLLRLALFGNYNYQNKNLNISNTNIRLNRFQQFKFYYDFKYKKLNIKTGLSYLIGNYLTSYNIKSGNIYTANYGSTIDINYDMKAYVSDTSNINPFANNGNGVAYDLIINFKIKDFKIEAYMYDIGSIKWKNSSIAYSADSTFIFSGVEVENILNFNDSILDEYSNNDIFTNENSKVTSYIPGQFGFYVTKNNNNKKISSYSGGINFKWQPHTTNKSESFSKLLENGFIESNYTPLIWSSTTYETKYIDIIPKFSFGGYSNDLNIGTVLKIGKKKNSFNLGTYNLEDIINGENAKALSFILQFIKQF